MRSVNIEEIQKLVDDTVQKISVNKFSLANAKENASRFLVVNAILSNYLRDLEEEIPKVETLENAEYAQAYSQSPSKNVTDKKVYVNTVKTYSDAKEKKEKLEARRNWIKNYIKIFDHAHLMYRQYSRD